MSAGRTGPRILLIGRDGGAGELREPLRGAGFLVMGSTDTLELMPPQLDGAQPDIVILDASAGDGDLAAMVRSLLSRWRDCCVVVTGTAVGPNAMSRAIAVGARGFLIRPYAAADLVEVVREAWEHSSGHSDERGDGERAPGQLVAVFGPKGGSGSSTVAVNLAVLLAADPALSVALVDLDLQFGDIGVLLDLRSPNSIVDLLDRGRLEPEVLSETFVRHASGVRALLAPPRIRDMATVDPLKVEQALQQLRDHFDVIVCDLWSNLDELTARVLGGADRILLVTKPDLPALRSASRLFAAPEFIHAADSRLLVIANRFPAKNGLSESQIAEALGHPIAATIPADGAAMTEAANRGIPAVDARVGSRAVPALRRLADLVRSELAAARAGRPTAAGPQQEVARR